MCVPHITALVRDNYWKQSPRGDLPQDLINFCLNLRIDSRLDNQVTVIEDDFSLGRAKVEPFVLDGGGQFA